MCLPSVGRMRSRGALPPPPEPPGADILWSAASRARLTLSLDRARLAAAAVSRWAPYRRPISTSSRCSISSSSSFVCICPPPLKLPTRLAGLTWREFPALSVFLSPVIFCIFPDNAISSAGPGNPPEVSAVSAALTLQRGLLCNADQAVPIRLHQHPAPVQGIGWPQNVLDGGKAAINCTLLTNRELVICMALTGLPIAAIVTHIEVSQCQPFHVISSKP